MVRQSKNAGETRADGMPVGTPFTSEYQPEGRGRPKGAISLSTRIRNILEGDEELPQVIQDTIKKSVGAGKRPIDAVVIVALLQALQGEKGWAEWLSNNGYGKPVETLKHTGDADNPVQLDGTLTVTLVRPKESSDE